MQQVTGGDSVELVAVHEREASFFDAAAAGLGYEPLRRPPDWFEQALLDAAEPLAGLDVLEVGCGHGELTMFLLEAGARVTGLDISAGMVELARRRTARFSKEGRAEFVVAPAEKTGLAAESFDVVIGKLVLHHLDLRLAISEVERLLRPGGRAVFIETSSFNALLRAARRFLVGRFGIDQVGTTDEHPLTRRDVRAIARTFNDCRVDHPVFLVFVIFARNVMRFRSRKWNERMLAWDNWIARTLPALLPMSYYARLRFSKSPQPERRYRSLSMSRSPWNMDHAR
jgi:SAM-dependent methyltransferase